METEIKWKKYKGVLVPLNAPHFEVHVDKNLLIRLYKKYNVWFIKWITEWDRTEKAYFYYVIKDKYKGLDEYSSNTRNQVKKGLRMCEVKKVTEEYIKENGYTVFKKAYTRYKTIPPSYEWFTMTYFGQEQKSEYFGVFDRGSNAFIGFAENQVKDNACIYGSIRLDPDYMNNYSNYALIDVMNKHYLEENKLRYVSDGARSLSHETNIQKMLIEKFKFRKAYCKLNFSIRFPLNIIINLLFPFRALIKIIPMEPFKLLYTLLKHVEISRNYK